MDQVRHDGNNALTAASHYGHREVVDLLLSAGADLGYLDVRGISPLYAAAQEGHLKVVKLLLNKGANIHQESIYGLMSVQIAALHSQSKHG